MVWDPMYPHPPVTRMHGGVDDSSLLIFGFGFAIQKYFDLLGKDSHVDLCASK